MSTPSPDPRSLPRRVFSKAYRSARRLLSPALEAVRDPNSLRAAQSAGPLMIAEKTYNTVHPQYDASLVRNFPDHFLGLEWPSKNALFLEFKKLAAGSPMVNFDRNNVLKEAAAEASTVPGYPQVMERVAYIENYMADLGRRYGAHYIAGWVNMVDAHFLYWLVRQAKPKVIVQTGVSNGLSSAFMMLALAKNGPDGKLYVIDLPAIFNPKEPSWTEKGKVYGVVIPEGKSSGWIGADMYRDRFDVQVGDAKVLLPPLIDRLNSIDMFFHNSDHSYNHMIFEFEQAVRKLRPGGLMVADDIAWNASLWDFADARNVPSYNYRGTMGVAFF